MALTLSKFVISFVESTVVGSKQGHALGWRRSNFSNHSQFEAREEAGLNPGMICSAEIELSRKLFRICMIRAEDSMWWTFGRYLLISLTRI